MIRIETFLLSLFSAVWLLAVLALFGLLPISGVLNLDLYRLYSVAAILGWVGGNVYLIRLRGLHAGRWSKRFLVVYLLGPPGFVYLLRAMAPLDTQQMAPLVPIFCFGVYALFFLVPVTLRRPPH
ncbi:MAG: hypothetical protein GY856_03325 [bacterium]|nr:hypothetical protein [bacterium]